MSALKIALGLVLVAGSCGCVPTEARARGSAIEGETADGATCSIDGSGDAFVGDALVVTDALFDDARDATSDAPTSPAPTVGFRLESTPLRAEVSRGANVTFEVTVVRASGFVAPIVLQAWGLPEGCAAEPVAVADLPGAFVVTAEGLAPATSHVPFAIGGSAAGHRATLRVEIAVVGPPIFEE